jgi:pimeloyl-ACP methyl ester carboxylesterase
VLICVDGTGPFFNVDYAVSTAGSFVGMIYYGSHLPNRVYYRGPDFSGTGPNMTQPMYVGMLIRELWRQGDHDIVMTGYSRGAAIAIETAAWLNQYLIRDGKPARVEAMFLFDAVNRSPDLSETTYIPPNVHYCYHAMRDDSAGSRSNFGHCGTLMNGADTFLVLKRFYTTHGGMGGLLWGAKGLNVAKESKDFVLQKAQGPLVRGAGDYNRTQLAQIKGAGHIYETFPDGLTNVTVAEEKAGSDKVHNWMWPFLHKHGVL